MVRWCDGEARLDAASSQLQRLRGCSAWRGVHWHYRNNGAARLFGGEQNPGKVETEVRVGDVVIVPAGVAHRLLEDVEGGFEMVGSYPKGCSWDMCYGKEGEEGKAAAAKDVKWLEKDPLYGDDGPVLWSKERLESRQAAERVGLHLVRVDRTLTTLQE